MPMKKHKPEQIVSLLRQIEVEMANGKTTPQACKEAEITVQTFYRWRKEIRVARRLGRYEVIEALADVMLLRGIPEHIRSDNGSAFVAEELRMWLAKVGTGTLYRKPERLLETAKPLEIAIEANPLGAKQSR